MVEAKRLTILVIPAILVAGLVLPGLNDADYLAAGANVLENVATSSDALSSLTSADIGGVIHASYYRYLTLNETDEDCYAQNGPQLTDPADGELIPSDPCECISRAFSMRWDPLCDAQRYDIQFALDEDFVSVLEGASETGYLPPAIEAPSYVVLEWALSCEVTYYWRVRAVKTDTDQIVRSLWSEPRQFTVGVGPGRGLYLGSSEPGATDVPITNITFAWHSEATFDSYHWVLSENADLSAPVGTATGLTGEAFTFTGSLKYNTLHFWQVSAFLSDTAVEDAIGTFLTVAGPAFPPSPGCFVATAAYDTPMAEEIQILREFRDECLLTSPLGKAFVDFHYRVSPPLAEFTAEHPSLRPMIRVSLLPAVAVCAVVVKTTSAQKLALLSLVPLLSVALVTWATRPRGGDSQHNCD